MDHQIKSFGALILAGLTFTILMPGRSIAQSAAIVDAQQLSLVSTKHLAEENTTTFDLQFETDELTLTGKASSFVTGFDSLSLDSFELIANEPNLMKIEGYLINKETQNKLKWTSAVNYATQSKDITLISGDYIQFAAYNKLKYAEKGLKFFDAFDLDIVFVGGMYKLVLPYNKDVFNQAKEQYQEYDIWRVEYEGVRVIQSASQEVMISSVSSTEKEDKEIVDEEVKAISALK